MNMFLNRRKIFAVVAWVIGVVMAILALLVPFEEETVGFDLWVVGIILGLSFLFAFMVSAFDCVFGRLRKRFLAADKRLGETFFIRAIGFIFLGISGAFLVRVIWDGLEALTASLFVGSMAVGLLLGTKAFKYVCERRKYA